MKQSEPQNLFELEGLEQRILLSGDPLPGVILAGLPEEPDPLFDTDPGFSSVEEVQLSDPDYLQETSPQDSDLYNPSDEIVDIFAGMSDEDDQTAVENDPPSNQLSCESAAMDLQSSQNSPDYFITKGEETAITNGLKKLANLGRVLEDFGDFGKPLPMTKGASVGALLRLHDIMDTRLKKPVYDYFNDTTGSEYYNRCVDRRV